MKKVLVLLLACSFCQALAAQSLDLEAILAAYQNSIKNIQRLSYQAHRIDTFATGGVWDRTGYVLIERNKEDTILGINFLGERKDLNKDYFYFQGMGYEVAPRKKRYTREPTSFEFLGSPGGQLVSVYMMYAGGGYQSIVVQETSEHYILQYSFEDDLTYDVKDRKRWLYLDKNTYLPNKLVEKKLQIGSRASMTLMISDIKINAAVERSLANYQSKLHQFKDKSPTITETSSGLIGTIPKAFQLPMLADSSVVVSLVKGKPTLLSFWEIWCGPCLASLPKLQKLDETFGEQLSVIGISTSDPSKTLEVMKNKEVGFMNLLGTDETLKAYAVSSFPSYFLIDKNGVITQAYLSFDYETISADIRQLLKKQK